LDGFEAGEAGADEAGSRVDVGGGGDDFGVVVFVGGVAVVPVSAAVGGVGWEILWCDAKVGDEVFGDFLEIGVGGESAGGVEDEWCFGVGVEEVGVVAVEVFEDVEDFVGGVGFLFDAVECFEAFEAGGDDDFGVGGGDGVLESGGAGFGFLLVALEAVGESAAVGDTAEDGVGGADVVEDFEGVADGGGGVDVAAGVEEEGCGGVGWVFHVFGEVAVLKFLCGDEGFLEESWEAFFWSADEEVASVGPGFFWCGWTHFFS
jgi:hypothetical protein